MAGETIIMQAVKPGDVVLYAVRTRQKDAQAYYYCCEVVASVPGGRPCNAAGEPVTGVRAVYHRRGAGGGSGPARRLLPRDPNDADEERRLRAELEKIYGPGELVAGFSCEGTCRLVRLGK